MGIDRSKHGRPVLGTHHIEVLRNVTRKQPSSSPVDVWHEPQRRTGVPVGPLAESKELRQAGIGLKPQRSPSYGVVVQGTAPMRLGWTEIREKRWGLERSHAWYERVDPLNAHHGQSFCRPAAWTRIFEARILATGLPT